MDGLTLIENDLFDIAKRLKEVDERYLLYRNAKLNRFEIYADGALQIAVPYDELDARTVELARRTRLEFVGRIIKEIDENNEKLERTRQKENRDKILARAEEAL